MEIYLAGSTSHLAEIACHKHVSRGRLRIHYESHDLMLAQEKVHTTLHGNSYPISAHEGVASTLSIAPKDFRYQIYYSLKILRCFY